MQRSNEFKSVILENEQSVKSQTKYVFEKRNKFFSFISKEDYERQESLGLDVITCGKSVLTAFTSYEQDFELYKDTRNQVKVSDSKSIATSLQTGIIIASSDKNNLLNVDSRIVSSKTILLQRIEEYNQKVKLYHQGSPYKWNNNLNFISL